jgi:hypothetical protein
MTIFLFYVMVCYGMVFIKFDEEFYVMLWYPAFTVSIDRWTGLDCTVLYWTIDYRLSTIDYRLSTIDYRLSTTVFRETHRGFSALHCKRIALQTHVAPLSFKNE